jgi:hypothetical protein
LEGDHMASPTMEIWSSFSSAQETEQIFKYCLRSKAIQPGKTNKVGVEFVQLTLFLHGVANQLYSVKQSSMFTLIYSFFPCSKHCVTSYLYICRQKISKIYVGVDIESRS